jgi:hypothetical protein
VCLALTHVARKRMRGADFVALFPYNVFHIQAAHTSELRTTTPKIDYSYYYTTTTLHNDPYSIAIDSWRLSHVRELWPIIPHMPQRFCQPVEPTCQVVSLATSVQT